MRKLGTAIMLVGIAAFIMPPLWEPVDPNAWPINPDGWWMAAGAAIAAVGWVVNRSTRA